LIAHEESGKKLETELYHNSTFLELIRLCHNNPNVTEKEMKTVNKGKVPKGFTNKVLLPAKAELQSRIDYFEYKPVKYHSWGTVFKQYYYDREAGKELPSKISSNEGKLDRPMKTITLRKPTRSVVKIISMEHFAWMIISLGVNTKATIGTIHSSRKGGSGQIGKMVKICGARRSISPKKGVSSITRRIPNTVLCVIGVTITATTLMFTMKKVCW